MRLPGILVLLNLLGASWATVTRNPSKIKLKWLEDEVIALPLTLLDRVAVGPIIMDVTTKES